MVELPALLDRRLGESNQVYLDRIYHCFWTDFVERAEAQVLDRPVYLKRGEWQRKGLAFRHVIFGSTQQHFSRERAAYVSWLRPMIDHYQQLIYWRNHRAQSENLCLVDRSWRYLIVLRARANYYLLWTAYPLSQSQRLKMKKEYARAHGEW